jgi:predicted RND superfamily exporter protein
MRKRGTIQEIYVKFDQLWEKYGQYVFRRRFVILGAAIVLIVLSLFGAGQIQIRTRIQDLLPANNAIVSSYNSISETFSTSTILMAIEGADKSRMIESAEILAALISEDKELMKSIRSINLKIDQDFLIDWGMILMDEVPLPASPDFLTNPGLLPLITAFNETLEKNRLDSGGKEALTSSDEREIIALFNRVENFTNGLTGWIQSQGRDAELTSRHLIDSLLVGDNYLFSPDYEMLIFALSPSFTLEERGRLTRVMEQIGTHLDTIRQQYPDLQFGTCGDIPREADEEKALSSDIVYPALVALVLIVILFYLSLHSLRSVVFSLIALVAGILFDVGLIGITIGELNMITSSFGALLVGLGIDFGIHIISRYGDSIEGGSSPEQALIITLNKIGKPVLLGGLTTSLAFYALCLSGTKGFIQFGFVSGTGILTVLISMFTILPALVVTFGKKKASGPKRVRIKFSFLEKWGECLDKGYSVPILVIAVLLTVTAAILLPRLSFDYDMQKIGPQNTPAKMTEARILEVFGMTPLPSFIAVPSLEEARELTNRLRDDETVSQVSSITDFLPPEADQIERLNRITAFRENIATTVSTPGSTQLMLDEILVIRLTKEIQRLEYNIIEIADIYAAGLGGQSLLISKRDRMIREINGAQTGLPGREVFQTAIAALAVDPLNSTERLFQIDKAFSSELFARLKRMVSVSRPLTVRDIPSSMKAESVSPGENSFLVTIYPTEQMVTREGMFRFAERMNDINPGITGTIQLSLELMREILSITWRAALMVMAVILLVLWLSFRNIAVTFLALFNLAVSIVWMMGLYSLVDSMNIVNVLAVPLIIGIGVDYSIHIIHHILTGHTLTQTIRDTGKPILLSALTTMIGFGSLAAVGTFHGVATLGILLFIGVGTCLLCSLTWMPVLVGLMYQKPAKGE